MSPHSVLAIALLFAIFAPAAAAQPASMIANGGFEGPYQQVNIGDGVTTRITGKVADGWQDNSGWAQVVIDYDEVTLDPHGGASAQRITVGRIAAGAVQMMQPGIDLVEGKAYRATVFARTRDAVPLRVLIRQPGPPYSTYAEKVFQPGPEWAECRFDFPSPVTGAVLFMLLPGEVGTIDVDDASLGPVDLEAGPPKEGNLVVTGRMIGAYANGWAPSNAPLPAFENVGPSPGEPAHVVIDGTAGGQVGLYSPPVIVNGNRVHTLSVDLRSDPPGAKLWVTMKDVRHDQSGPGTVMQAGADWARRSFTEVIPHVDASAIAVRIAVLDPARVSVRNVQLVEGEGPVEFEPAVPVEVAVVPVAPNGLSFAGDVAELTLLAVGEIPDGAQFDMSVHDVLGNAEKLPPLPVPAGAHHEEKVGLPWDRKNGLFRFEARVVDAAGNAVSNTGQGLFAWVTPPRYPDRLMPDSPFGVHIPLDDSYTRLAQNLGFKWCRIHDASIITKWHGAEPERGRFTFYDDRVRLARERGLMVLGMLDAAPAWASDAPPDLNNSYFRVYFRPRSLADWRNYVRTVVGHYRGSIDHWEVWNEPWVDSFFRKYEGGQMLHGTPADYVPLLEAAYEEAKAANPGAVVLGIDSNPPDWTRGCLDEGAAAAMDVFSFHQYTARLAGRAGGTLEALVGSHRAVLAEHGLAGIEVWNTEGGPDNKEDCLYRDLDPFATSSGHYEAIWHARYYMANMALGIRKFFFYTLHAHPRLGQYTWVRLEPGGYLKAWAVAQANMANLLEGTQFRRAFRTDDGLVCYLFEGDGRTVAALFAELRPATPRALQGLEALDLYGNPTKVGEVGQAPIYLTGEAAEKAVASLGR